MEREYNKQFGWITQALGYVANDNFILLRNRMKPIPFSPPRIDQKTIDAVTEVLLSGWITTGPKTRELESRINEYCESKRTLC